MLHSSNYSESRFLLPPVKMEATSSDLTVDGGDFVGPLLRLSMDLEVDAKVFLQVPYDYCCSSVEQKLASRPCKYYGIYRVSIKSVNCHFKVHAVLSNTVSVVRPIKVAPRFKLRVGRLLNGLMRNRRKKYFITTLPIK